MRFPRLALLILLSSLVGCQREDAPASSAPGGGAETGAPTSPTAAPSAAPRADLHDDPPIPLPAPARRRLAAAVAENARCEACHDDEAREWRGSYHQRANLDPAYRAAFAVEPLPFCRSCHAPEADPRVEPPPPVSALGVGCVSCHVTEPGMVLAAAHPEERGDPERPAAPHPLRRSIDFARTGGCAGCHEFRFPRPGGPDDAFFMQTTVREHLRSPAAERPCADCHMPLKEGRRSHAFSEVRDPAFLRENLRATAERTPEGTLRITLVQPKPGHDFPTGDLFRRLEVGYEILDENGRKISGETRHLARHFELVPGVQGRQLTGDDRVQGEPLVLDFTGAPAATRLSWWVSYQRVATVGTGTKPSEAIIESEVKLHAGSLAWSDP